MSNKEINLTAVDKVVRYLDPVGFNKRIQAKIHSELLVSRQYDAAYVNPQSPIKRNAKSANNELSSAIAPIRFNVRELVRNAPFAKKGLDIIVNGVVGWGIEPYITHPDKKKEEKIKELWKAWSSGLCSIDGKTDFFTLQKQVMASVVSDGEVVVREVILDDSVRLLLLEADVIENAKIKNLPQDQTVSNGIVMDSFGRPVAYNLLSAHPGDLSLKKPTASLVDSKEIIHVFRTDRPGQNRGVSWFAPVVQSINMLNELQWTQLVRMKLGSAITAVVTQQPSQLSPELLQQQRQEEWALSPGDVKYINPGESIEFPTIPNTEGFESATRLTLREIAAGLGVTYEALANDLSTVNFSSGRLGDIQFRSNVDQWRWHMLIPRFCNPAFDRFKKYCAIKGVDASATVVEWTPPARQMIDPTSEVSATRDAIRCGFQTIPGALRELGLNPESHLLEISKTNELLDSLGLILDSDPRRISNQQLQSPDSLAGMKLDQAKKK